MPERAEERRHDAQRSARAARRSPAAGSPRISADHEQRDRHDQLQVAVVELSKSYWIAVPPPTSAAHARAEVAARRRAACGTRLERLRRVRVVARGSRDSCAIAAVASSAPGRRHRRDARRRRAVAARTSRDVGRASPARPRARPAPSSATACPAGNARSSTLEAVDALGLLLEEAGDRVVLLVGEQAERADAEERDRHPERRARALRARGRRTGARGPAARARRRPGRRRPSAARPEAAPADDRRASPAAASDRRLNAAATPIADDRAERVDRARSRRPAARASPGRRSGRWRGSPGPSGAAARAIASCLSSSRRSSSR